MARATSQGMWLQVPALDVSETQAPSNRLSCYNNCLEHYRTCRRAHAGARLLGAISFYHVKRFQLYAGEGQHSTYEDWAHSFKNHPDNPELRTADMEWLARAGGVMSYVMQLEDLPDQGRRADYVLQEVGSLTQLKAVFSKVFNKKIPWNDGERLQDVGLLVYEFRKINDALKAPGTIQKLFRDKWPSKAKKAATVTGSAVAEPMFPPAMQEEPAAAAQAASAAGAAAAGAGPAAEHPSEGSDMEGSPGATSALAGPTPAVTAPAAAPAATATTAVTTGMAAATGHGADGSNIISSAATAGTASPIAVSSAAVNSAPELTTAAEAAAGGSGCAAVGAGVAVAAAGDVGASGAAGEARQHLQTAWSGCGRNPQEEEWQVQQPAAHQRNLKIHLPAACIQSREPSAAGVVAEPQPDSPAQPRSPFQQFLHVLIEDNRRNSTDAPQQQEQQEEDLGDEHAREQRRQQQAQQQQQQQQSQSSRDDARVDEGHAVSEDCQPPAAAAEEGLATGRKGKRTSFELGAADKPGPSKRPKKQQRRGTDSKAGSKAAGSGSGNALTVDCAIGGSLDGSTGTTPSTTAGPITPCQQTEPNAEPEVAETSSADDDSSMSDNSSETDAAAAQQQPQLVRDLQQKRLLGGTLLQWMEEHAPKTGLRITVEQAQQEGGLLNQVFVVAKWGDELKPLVSFKKNRAFMVIVVPDQQAAAADVDVNSADGGAAEQVNGTASEWKGQPAEWLVHNGMLTACKALKQRSGPQGDHIVASHASSNLQLRHNDLACSRAPAWLSDECVNFYMALLQERDSLMYDNRHLFREGTGAYRTYYFNSHFTSKLRLGGGDYNYKDVQRWTSPTQRATRTASGDDSAMLQREVLNYDRLVIPIHQQTPYQHWTVLLVDLQQQRLVFFDSYKMDNPIGPMAMERVKSWLADEAKDKLGEDWDPSDWAEKFPADLPRQENDYDCGVFALMACNRLGLRGGVFDFDQECMVSVRAAIAHDLQAARIVASANPSSA